MVQEAASEATTDDDASLIELIGLLREQGYKFTTVTPLTQARVNQRAGNFWATDPIGVFGWSRPFREGLLPDAVTGLMRAANILATADGGVCRSRVRVSTLGAQFFVHSAYPTTDADSVFFGPDSVRFAQAIARHLNERARPPSRVADVGCGAGPGGILIASVVDHADVLMVDINPLALRYARVNAAINRVSARACHSDILANTCGSFDLIVSNPPYLIDASGRTYRHGGGRFGEGLSFKVFKQSVSRLLPGGTLLLYTGSTIISGEDMFAEACRDHLQAAQLRWSYTEVDPDVFGEELEGGAYAAADRIAAVVLTVTNERVL